MERAAAKFESWQREYWRLWKVLLWRQRASLVPGKETSPVVLQLSSGVLSAVLWRKANSCEDWSVGEVYGRVNVSAGYCPTLHHRSNLLVRCLSFVWRWKHVMEKVGWGSKWREALEHGRPQGRLTLHGTHGFIACLNLHTLQQIEMSPQNISATAKIKAPYLKIQ